MKKNNIGKEILDYAIIIIAVLVIRTFLFTPIQVEQKSMIPTLDPNDIMVLNKIGYNLFGVNRFDIVVIKVEDEYIIKRVIGLPGEKIEYKNGKLLVNDKVVNEDFIDVYTEDFVLDSIGYDKIPKDKYFVLGDNRGNSTDSRVLGLIDKKDILGKTNFILFPFNKFGIVK
jgi:signal peptidase I